MYQSGDSVKSRVPSGGYDQNIIQPQMLPQPQRSPTDKSNMMQMMDQQNRSGHKYVQQFDPQIKIPNISPSPVDHHQVHPQQQASAMQTMHMEQQQQQMMQQMQYQQSSPHSQTSPMQVVQTQSPQPPKVSPQPPANNMMQTLHNMDNSHVQQSNAGVQASIVQQQNTGPVQATSGSIQQAHMQQSAPGVQQTHPQQQTSGVQHVTQQPPAHVQQPPHVQQQTTAGVQTSSVQQQSSAGIQTPHVSQQASAGVQTMLPQQNIPYQQAGMNLVQQHMAHNQPVQQAMMSAQPNVHARMSNSHPSANTNTHNTHGSSNASTHASANTQTSSEHQQKNTHLVNIQPNPNPPTSSQLQSTHMQAQQSTAILQNIQPMPAQHMPPAIQQQPSPQQQRSPQQQPSPQQTHIQQQMSPQQHMQQQPSPQHIHQNQIQQQMPTAQMSGQQPHPAQQLSPQQPRPQLVQQQTQTMSPHLTQPQRISQPKHSPSASTNTSSHMNQSPSVRHTQTSTKSTKSSRSNARSRSKGSSHSHSGSYHQGLTPIQPAPPPGQAPSMHTLGGIQMSASQLAMIGVGGLQPQVMGQPPTAHPYLAMAGVGSYGAAPSAGSPADQRLPHGVLNQHVMQQSSSASTHQSHSPNPSNTLQRSNSSACAVSGAPGIFQMGSPSPTGPGTPNSGSNTTHTPNASPSAQSHSPSGSCSQQQAAMAAGSLHELQRMTNGLPTDVPVCANMSVPPQNAPYMNTTSRISTPPSQHKQSYSHGHSRSRQSNQRPPNVTLNHSLMGYPGMNMNGYPQMGHHPGYLTNSGFINQSQIPGMNMNMMHSQANFNDGSGRGGVPSAQNPMYTYPYINSLMGPLNGSMGRR